MATKLKIDSLVRVQYCPLPEIWWLTGVVNERSLSVSLFLKILLKRYIQVQYRTSETGFPWRVGDGRPGLFPSGVGNPQDITPRLPVRYPKPSQYSMRGYGSDTIQHRIWESPGLSGLRHKPDRSKTCPEAINYLKRASGRQQYPPTRVEIAHFSVMETDRASKECTMKKGKPCILFGKRFTKGLSVTWKSPMTEVADCWRN